MALLTVIGQMDRAYPSQRSVGRSLVLHTAESRSLHLCACG